MRHNMLIGTYTTGKPGEGIYRISVDSNGRFSAPELAARLVDPSYLAVNSDNTRIYAVSERPGTGALYALENGDGALAKLAEVSAGGQAPCHLALSPDGKWLAVANYMDGSVAVYDVADGEPKAMQLQPARTDAPGLWRQECAHAHMARFTAGELWVSDLGCDMIRRFTLREGVWSEAEPVLRLPAGAGPRHFALSDDGCAAYILCELDRHLRAYRRGARDFELAADIALSDAARTGKPVEHDTGAGALRRDGDMLLCSIRQDNALCLVNCGGGGLEYVRGFDCGGVNPRDAIFVGENIVCCCQDEGGLVCLSRTGEVLDRAEIGAPVCALPLD